MWDVDRTFDIGARNELAVNAVLADLRIAVAAADVGGSSSRTVRLFAANGRAVVRTPFGPEYEL
jgi:chemotaxis receptor (MCP) glutamine deamidase CheD